MFGRRDTVEAVYGGTVLSGHTGLSGQLLT